MQLMGRSSNMRMDRNAGPLFSPTVMLAPLGVGTYPTLSVSIRIGPRERFGNGGAHPAAPGLGSSCRDAASFPRRIQLATPWSFEATDHPPLCEGCSGRERSPRSYSESEKRLEQLEATRRRKSDNELEAAE